MSRPSFEDPTAPEGSPSLRLPLISRIAPSIGGPRSTRSIASPRVAAGPTVSATSPKNCRMPPWRTPDKRRGANKRTDPICVKHQPWKVYFVVGHLIMCKAYLIKQAGWRNAMTMFGLSDGIFAPHDFHDTACDCLDEELAKIADGARDARKHSGRARLTRKSGVEFGGPKYGLATDQIAVHHTIGQTRTHREENGSGSEQTCPGGSSKSFKRAKSARAVLEQDPRCRAAVLDTSRLGRGLLSVIIHGDTERAENVRRSVANWLKSMLYTGGQTRRGGPPCRLPGAPRHQSSFS